MRAHEFITEAVNLATTKPGFSKEKWYRGRYLLKAEARQSEEYEERPVKGLIIKVFDPKTTSILLKSSGIAHARFIVTGDHMVVSSVYVSSEYQRQGIASAMYNFARELGNDIMPSSGQTEQGKAFWATGAGVGRLTPDQPPELETPALPAPVSATKPSKPGFFKRLVGLKK